MNKTILILSASPRKGGNTDQLCDQVLKGAEAAGHHGRIVRLADLRLQPCLACDHCRKNGGNCVHKDGQGPVLEDMAAADEVVLATPVYFYTMAAQMKTFIDRTYARFDSMGSKSFSLIAVAADPDQANLDLTVDDLKAFVGLIGQSSVKSVLKAGGAAEKGDVATLPAFAQAYQLGAGL